MEGLKYIYQIQPHNVLHIPRMSLKDVGQGRTETWYRSLPHYVMVHLVYHWNKNPKKK